MVSSPLLASHVQFGEPSQSLASRVGNLYQHTSTISPPPPSFPRPSRALAVQIECLARLPPNPFSPHLGPPWSVERMPCLEPGFSVCCLPALVCTASSSRLTLPALSRLCLEWGGPGSRRRWIPRKLEENQCLRDSREGISVHFSPRMTPLFLQSPSLPPVCFGRT